MDAFQWINVLLAVITVLLTAVSVFLQAIQMIKDKKGSILQHKKRRYR